ncbi:MAG: hypothetical protein R2710_25705 [Acidimicrobiales bacterium]
MPWHAVSDHRSPWFENMARKIEGKRVLAAGTAVVMLLGLAGPLLGLKTGMPSVTVLPKDEQARQGYDLLAQAFGPGELIPLQIIVPAGADAAAVAEQVGATPGIAMAFPRRPLAPLVPR